MAEKPNIQQVYAQVVEKAGKDGKFRTLLIANPHAALKELTGVDIPKTFDLKVVEQPSNGMVIMVPPMAGAELSDSDLEAVAGGKGDSSAQAGDFFAGLGSGVVSGLTGGNVNLYSPSGTAGDVGAGLGIGVGAGVGIVAGA